MILAAMSRSVLVIDTDDMRKPPTLATRKAQRSRTSTTRWPHLYASHRWRVASERFRAEPENVLCVMCRAEGRITQSRCVDHFPEHNGDTAKFWDQSTWRPLCNSCHSRRHRQGDKHGPRGCDQHGIPLDPAHGWHQDSPA